MPELELEHRTEVWSALAELFVARELQDYDYHSIAGVLRTSGLSAERIRDVLQNEVAPAFMDNLSPFNPVPNLEGWSAREVSEQILLTLVYSRGIMGQVQRLFRRNPLRHPILKARWLALERLLGS